MGGLFCKGASLKRLQVLITAVMLTAFLAAAAVAAAVQETGKCEPTSGTGVYEEEAGGSAAKCEEEDPPTPVPCTYDSYCDPCVYPMGTSEGNGSDSADAAVYYPCYPCYYVMGATEDGSGAAEGGRSGAYWYYPCYPCYYYPVAYDESGSDPNATAMYVACYPCGETADQAGTSDEAAASESPMIVCPAETEGTTGAATEA